MNIRRTTALLQDSTFYFLENSVFAFNNSANGAVIQNCTQEWGGNTLFMINRGIPQYDYSLVGDGVYCVSPNATLQNNYIRQCGNAFTFENSWEHLDHLGTYTCTGNLIENSGQGIRTYLGKEHDAGVFEKVILRDNIILNTGDSINNA